MLQLFLLLTLLGLVAAEPAAPTSAPAKLRILLIGDSTVAASAGWGPGLARVMPDAEIINRAQNGRSSKSFRDEGHWDKALAEPADYVMIQFGHNDQPGKGPERETDPQTTYHDNLTRYVSEARAAGMKPILVTSLARRNFNNDGTLKDTLAPYAQATRRVAGETGVPVIDLHAKSLALYLRLGKDKTNELMSVKRSDGTLDTTHLQGSGVDRVGAMVANQLAAAVPELAPLIKLDSTEEKQ